MPPRARRPRILKRNASTMQDRVCDRKPFGLILVSGVTTRSKILTPASARRWSGPLDPTGAKRPSNGIDPEVDRHDAIDDSEGEGGYDTTLVCHVSRQYSHPCNDARNVLPADCVEDYVTRPVERDRV